MSESAYALNVGMEGATRLSLVQEIYGPTSRERLLGAGLASAMRVLELGSGSGAMTRFLAETVGPGGSVVAVDGSASQIETARAACEGLSQLEFVVADAARTGLEPGSFDLVYARLLLMHVLDPAAVLAHARELLRPGGVLVVEESAVRSTTTDPLVREQAELHALAHELGSERGADFDVALRLASLTREAGFELEEVARLAPVFLRGKEKYLEVASFREALGHWSSASKEKLARGYEVLEALERAASDTTTAYGLGEMTLVRARVPALS